MAHRLEIQTRKQIYNKFSNSQVYKKKITLFNCEVFRATEIHKKVLSVT